MSTMRKIIFYLVIVVLVVVVLFPLYWVMATSIKSIRDAFAIPPVWIFEATWENYAKVLNNGVFLRAFVNSIIVSFTASIIAVAIGSLAAYGLVMATMVIGYVVWMLRRVPVVLGIVLVAALSMSIFHLSSVLPFILLAVFVSRPQHRQVQAEPVEEWSASMSSTNLAGANSLST